MSSRWQRLSPRTRTTIKWIYYPILGISTWDFIHTNIIRLEWVSGPSMSPTLAPSYHENGSRDLVLILRRTFPFRSVLSDLRRGDVVTLTKPHDPSGQSVKRVVGLPGDTVLRDLRRVGKEAQEEGKNTRELGMQVQGPVVRVPSGSVWLEGDAWRMSRDSNDFGPVSQSLLNGRVWGVVWPLERFGALPRSEGVGGREKKAKAPDSKTVVIEMKTEPVIHVDLI